MAITVGARPEASFLDPVGMLTDCHRRVLRFLGDLMSVSGTFAGEVLPALSQQQLVTALRYFREAAPNHTADEEETLFPRLRAVPDHPGLRGALELVESLERDHRVAVVLAPDHLLYLKAGILRQKSEIVRRVQAMLAKVLQNLRIQHPALKVGSQRLTRPIVQQQRAARLEDAVHLPQSRKRA